MAQIRTQREKYEKFYLRLSEPDELQELQWSHVGRLIFQGFSSFFKNRVECPFSHFVEKKLDLNFASWDPHQTWAPRHSTT